jgi:flagellar basal-body rod protein FlgG
MKALSIAATGMLAQQLNVDVISNNIANMNTTSFKQQRPEFQDLIYQNIQRVGATSSDTGTLVPSGIQIGVGVKAASVYRITNQGELLATDNALDLAIMGNGYFGVQLPSGDTAYTRAGTFQLSPTGEIVTAEGFVVDPGIVIPADAVDISVNKNGDVEVKIAGQITPQIVGQIELVGFPNPPGLEAVGDNMLLESPSSGSPSPGTPGTNGLGTIQHGFLETSNVNAVSQIANLIAAQRAYDMNSKVIQTADEMMSTVNQLR